MPNAISQFAKPTNDFFDTTAMWLSDQPFSAAKAGYIFIDVLKEASMIPESFKGEFASARHHLNLIKLARAPGDLMKKANEIRHAVADCLEAPSVKGAATIVRKGAQIILPVWEGVDFLTKAVVNIPKETLWVQNLRGVGGGALAFSMFWNVCEDLSALANSKLYGATDSKTRSAEFTKVAKSLINLAKNISYIVLGVMTLLTVFFGYVFAPVIMTAWSASTVVFGILGYYHTNWGAERKGAI